MVLERDAILNNMRENVIEVSFNKVDGASRLLRCTLRPDLLPKKYLTEEAAERDYHTANPEVIAAWDVVNGGWRSFRMDSVVYIQQVDSF